jgi:hypothetical protein
MEFVRSSISIVSGLPCDKARSAPAITFSRPAQRSLTLWPARSPSRLATLYTEGSDSFVASAAASIATGWSEPVPGRELHPLKSSAFSRRTLSPVSVPVAGSRGRTRQGSAAEPVGSAFAISLTQDLATIFGRDRSRRIGLTAILSRPAAQDRSENPKSRQDCSNDSSLALWRSTSRAA